MVLSRLLKDSAIYGGADFATKVVSFFTFPVIAAALNPMAFGVLELVGTVTALLGIAMNCGLNNAVQRFYWDVDTPDLMRPTVVTSGLAAMLAFGVAVLVGGLAATSWVHGLATEASWPIGKVGIVSALAVLVLTQWNQYSVDVLRLHMAPWRFLAVAALTRVLSLGVGIAAVVWLAAGVDGLLAGQALVLLVVLPVAFAMIRSDIAPLSFRRDWMARLVSFGFPFIFAGLAHWLFGSMDRWMLMGMASVEEVGLYSVAFRFSTIVMFVAGAFGQAWSPVSMRVRLENPDSYRSIYGDVLILLTYALLMVAAGIALFAGELIETMMPASYSGAAVPMVILCFSVVLQASQQVTATGISLEKRTDIFAKLAWLTAGVNFAGNWLLIPRFGASGAASATALSYAVLSGSYLWATQRLHPIVVDWSRLGRLCLLAAALVVAAVIGTRVTLEPSAVLLKSVIWLLAGLLGWQLLPLETAKVAVGRGIP